MFSGASNYANSVDDVMLFIVSVSIVLLLGITISMIYFVFRYNKKRNPVATQIHGNITLEIIWIVLPTILVIIMFFYGFQGFKNLRETKANAYVVKVHAFQWGWNFEYDNGKQTDTLYIPMGRTTKLEMQSRDVNHSLFIPAFRLKEDVIGGHVSYIILQPKDTGTYDIACAEYCGLNHSKMYTKLHVMHDGDFWAWLDKGANKKDSTATESKSADSTEKAPEVQNAGMGGK